MKTADQQVGMPIVVVIGDSGPDVIVVAAETGAVRHIGEPHSAEVAQQPVRRFLAGRQCAAVGEEQVELAVAVEVEGCNSSRGGGGKWLLLFRISDYESKGQVVDSPVAG